MPLPSNTWQNAMRRMQPTVQGGAMPAADPGEMGNIAYAPGMMQFDRPGAPKARDLTGAGIQGPPPLQTGGQPTQGTQPGPPSMPALPPEFAQSAINAIMEAIRRRSGRYY